MSTLGRFASILSRLPLGPGISAAIGRLRARRFAGSAQYWELRYTQGGDSGVGSYGRLAQYKAEVLNSLVDREKIRRVIEFGCGDGAQLSLARYPEYLGLDIALSAVELCRLRFKDDPGKRFEVYPLDERPVGYDLALSLDVTYHLVEEEVFERHLNDLFDSSRRLVAIYTSDSEVASASPHIRHRAVTAWVSANRPDWTLKETLNNPYQARAGHDSADTSFASFFIYTRVGD